MNQTREATSTFDNPADGDSLYNIRQHTVILPDSAYCGGVCDACNGYGRVDGEHGYVRLCKKCMGVGRTSGCGNWDWDNPELQETVAEAGRKMMEVPRCLCSLVTSERRRLDSDRWAASNMPNRGAGAQPRTFDNALEEDGNKKAIKAARDVADALGPQPFLVLVGARGTGKSHLLEAIGRTWLHNGKTVRYDFVPDLLDELRAANTDLEGGSVHVRMEQRHGFNLLLLDDLGQGNASDWVSEKLNELVDYRIRNGGALAVATNKTKDGIAEWADERLAGRLWNQDGSVKVVHLTNADFRSRKKK